MEAALFGTACHTRVKSFKTPRKTLFNGRVYSFQEEEEGRGGVTTTSQVCLPIAIAGFGWESKPPPYFPLPLIKYTSERSTAHGSALGGARPARLPLRQSSSLEAGELAT